MEIVIKAFMIAVTGTLLGLIIKRTTPELSTLLSLAISAVLVVLSMKVYSEVSETLKLADLDLSISKAYTEPIIKCIGIGIVARLGSDICKDANQNAVASSVEICGAVCAIFAALPLIRTFIRMIGELA